MRTLTGRTKSMIGMIHVQALPGTPRHRLPIDQICAIAVEEGRILRRTGFNAVIVENMHDVPYLNRRVGPEIVACMTAVARAVRKAVDLPLGIQVLAGCNRESLSVALAAGADFIRAEGFVFGHVADEGLMQSDAAELLRFRRAIGAEHIRILVDIKKKHASHAITADVSVAETAAAAEFFGADSLVITGSRTGIAPDLADLQATGRACALPRLVGSGITPETLRELWADAEGFIVGSAIKKEGRWQEPVDPHRASAIIQAAEEMRQMIRPTQSSDSFEKLYNITPLPVSVPKSGDAAPITPTPPEAKP